MKRQLKFILGAGFTLFSFTSFLFSVSVSAEEEPAETMIELSNEEYEKYINDLLRPTFFQEFINEMSASAVVDLNKNAYTSTNVPKKSGAGSAGDIIKSIGSEIIKDVINNSMVTNGGYQIPDFKQQAGKVRNVYNSGMVEIITCYITTYQTAETGTFGVSTGKYKDHCILTFIREIDGYYTTTTICDTYSEKFCTFSDSGNVSLNYSPSNTFYGIRFYDYKTNTTISNTVADVASRVPAYGSRYDLQFYDMGASSDEIPVSVIYPKIYFGSFQKQGISEISSGSSYKTLHSILYTNNVINMNNTSIQGIVFSVMETTTNNYQDFSQQKAYDNDTEYKQSITYLDKVNSSDIINSNNVNNYDFLTIEGDRLTTNNNYDSWYQSNVSEVVENNITNVYNNYWITPTDPPTSTQPPTDPPETLPPVTQPPTDPPETLPPVTQPPTDPPETLPPVTQPPTDPSETLPPVTQPVTDPPETFPPNSGETLLPEYTLDVSAVSSGIADIKKQAFTLDFSGSFWLLDIMDYLLTVTGLLPFFIFAFLMSLLGYFLWK